MRRLAVAGVLAALGAAAFAAEPPAVAASFYLGDLHPRDLALSPDGTRLYVAACLPGEGDSGELRFLSAADGKAVCDAVKVGGEPLGIALASDGRTGYVTNTGDGYAVTRFTTDRCKAAGSVRSGSGPDGVGLSKDGERIFVGNNWESFLTVFDGKWREPLARIDGFGTGTSRVVATTDGRYLYVAGRTGKLWKVDTANLTAGRPLPIAAGDLAVSGDGRFVCAAGLAADPAIRVLATASDDEVMRLPLDTPATGLAVMPGGRYLYAALPKPGQVAVFDLDQGAEIARVRAGAGARRVAVSPDGKSIYVACAGDTRVVVLTTGDLGAAASSTRLMDSRVKVAAATPVGLTRTSPGAVLSVAVADLDAQGIADSSAAVVSEWLRGALVQGGAFNVLERKNMRRVLEEQAIQQTGCTSEECAVKLGRLLNVQRMIVGSVGRFENDYVVNVRVIDIETGKAVASDSAKGSSIDDVETGVKALARRLAQAP